VLGGRELASAIVQEQLIFMAITSGELLPLAVAIAISITTIITTVLMLLSEKAKRRSVGLLVGVRGRGWGRRCTLRVAR
jgi:hypothetical protein